MPAMYISPKQYEASMIEINIAFEVANKRIDMLQEKVQELEEAAKANSSKTTTKKTS
jgi:hypothetical protein